MKSVVRSINLRDTGHLHLG